jgi:hypothetical protein
MYCVIMFEQYTLFCLHVAGVLLNLRFVRAKWNKMPLRSARMSQYNWKLKKLPRGSLNAICYSYDVHR